MSDITKVRTPPFKLSFPNLFKHGEMDGESTNKYDATMLFEKNADLKPMKALLKKALEDAIKNKWKGKKPANLKTPFHDQGDKDYDGYEAGSMYATASSYKRKPGVVGKDGSPITADDDLMYPGCVCIATVTAYAYDRKSKGIAFGLNNIMRLEDGERLDGGGGPSADEDFADMIDGEESGSAEEDDEDSIF